MKTGPHVQQTSACDHLYRHLKVTDGFELGLDALASETKGETNLK
jgi:hypothetical protein